MDLIQTIGISAVFDIPVATPPWIAVGQFVGVQNTIPVRVRPETFGEDPVRISILEATPVRDDDVTEFVYNDGRICLPVRRIGVDLELVADWR